MRIRSCAKVLETARLANTKGSETVRNKMAFDLNKKFFVLVEQKLIGGKTNTVQYLTRNWIARNIEKLAANILVYVEKNTEKDLQGSLLCLLMPNTPKSLYGYELCLPLVKKRWM